MWAARVAAVPLWCRALRSSAGLGGPRNLLRKMLRKNKKKFWYDSPTLGSQTLYKPTKLDFLRKNELTKTRKEDNMRCRVLNGLIHKAVLEMATTCEVSQEFYDLKLEICKVSLSSNFSACRVYWNPTSTMEKESFVESVLRKSAPRIRYLLKSQQIVGNVPPVVFIKDKEAAAVKEVEDLLAIADFGPPEEEETSQNDSSKRFPNKTFFPLSKDFVLQYSMLLRFLTAKGTIPNFCEQNRCRGKLRMLIASPWKASTKYTTGIHVS
ncbi:putative ribosome-binding factor A, mitochondrial isoform X2 [Taeniopygia guttata]|uniref:putative ribosome-binding factor A, mitochondrial isoform X2 n=1 Tax=Taeniopygia guttata TaxID=59729 RepID=UPI003BB8C03E